MLCKALLKRSGASSLLVNGTTIRLFSTGIENAPAEFKSNITPGIKEKVSTKGNMFLEPNVNLYLCL